MFIQNITAVKDHLESSDGTVNLPQRREVIREMVIEMNTLLGVLRSLGQEWQKYLDIRERNSYSFAYHADIEHRTYFSASIYVD